MEKEGIKIFYRYEAVQYASSHDHDGVYYESPLPNIKLELRQLNLFKETQKGYWIGYGILFNDKNLRGIGHWISKTSKKRFAYPTKEEALENFIKRTECRMRILSQQIDVCRTSIDLAKQKTKNL
jgi:hypothetical protein